MCIRDSGYPEEVEKEAEKIPETITDEEIAARRDMRGVATFTIDPADAKDFDDALSIRRLENGNYEVGVHIADVTHYVHPGDLIDTEGQNRATSVYLVDRTIPMLPERLSNGLCSLRPHEEKLCFSAVFELDEQAQVLGEWFGRTVIYSDRRFTYQEAQEVIETGRGDFADEILKLNGLAQTLRKERFRNGSISFEREEAKFDLDENGKPLRVYFKAVSYTHLDVYKRQGMEPAYLSREYFDRYEEMLRISERLGQKLIVYDDIDFPSGTAGGLSLIHI